MKGRAEFPYTKLPGTLRGFVRRASLWEGPDHLLSVTGTRFAEEYRRFYYRDIESIVSQKCARAGSFGLWIVHVLACVVLGSIAAASPFPWSLGILACFLLLVLIFRLIGCLRYSCRCYIQTAVSRKELPSLLRTWSTEKALKRIRSRIEEAQGALPEEVGSLQEEVVTAVPASAKPSLGKPRSAGIRLATLAFLLLLANAAECFCSLRLASYASSEVWARVRDILLVYGEGTCIVLALLCIYRWRTFRGLRNVLFGCLGFVAAEVWFSLNFRNVYAAWVKEMHVVPHFYQAWHWVLATIGSVAGVLAIGGLILLFLKRDTYRRGDLSTN
ncbi:MAG TPA: hypothetical protein VF283_01590 [Bryobacteraceae bacterium]